MDKPRVRGPAVQANGANNPWFDAVVDVTPQSDSATGGGIEGAQRFSREMASWHPNMGSPDQLINRSKALADMRGRDQMYNDGYARSGVSLHQDSIIGSQYSLTVEPDYAVLGSGSNAGRSAPKFDETWAEEVAEIVEARFNLIAESEDCYLDASGTQTFTGMMRLAVGGFVWTGEVLASAEWLYGLRPLHTAIRMVSPSRLVNEHNLPDTQTLRGGVEKDANGRPIRFHIRDGYAGDPYGKIYGWTKVPARTKWGRRQMIHIIEPREADQTRGLGDMVSALKHMKMTKNFSEITLQNAVVQASYAAAIESELPPEAIQAMMGGNTGGANYMTAIDTYLTALGTYVKDAGGIAVDGVKIPHLFPGTKLKAMQLGTPGGIGQDFEASLLRHAAAALGVSYEEFAHDFSKTSYISARASMNTTGRFMRARKKNVADRFATQMYQLIFEEEMGAGNIPLPAGVDREYFYRPLMKEAFTACSWTGSGTGQIDELKETQAAILRIKSGLSTWRAESARLGGNWRKNFKQLSVEGILQKKLGIMVDMNAEKSASGASTQGNLNKANPKD